MFFRQLPVYVVVLLTNLTVAPAHADETEKHFSLTELQAMALRNSPAFQVIQDQIDIAKAGIRTAKAFPNPEIEVLEGPSKNRNGSAAATGNTRSSSIVQTLDLPNRRWARIDAAEAALTAAEATGASDSASLITQLQIRYYELLRREAELKAAREDASLIEAIRHRIAKRVEVGESPRFELIKIDTETLNAQKLVQSANVRVQQSRAAVRQIVGRELPADFALSGRLTDAKEPPAVDEIRATILQSNPDLRRGRAEIQQYEAQLNYAQALRWPDLAIKAGRDEDPELRTNRVGIVMTLPLWDWKFGPVAEARANLSRARHQLSQQEFSLEQDIDVAYQRLEIARNQVNALENGIIRQAEAALQIAEAAYRFGERGFIDVLDAQRVFRAARNELIGARFEFAAACSDIDRLRTPIPENLTP
jgi:cobalt-zinc-cadmium efflux system outer membrane protein